MTTPDNHSDAELMQIGTLIEAIYHVQSQEDLFHKIVSLVPGFVSADRVSVTCYEEASRQIEMVALYGVVDPDGRMQLGKRISIGKDYQQYHDSVCTPSIWQPGEVQDNSGSRSTGELLKQMQMKSVMNVPIMRQGRIIGTLNVGSRSVIYCPADLANLKQITTLVGVAVERIAYNDLQQDASERHRLYADHLELLNVLGEKLSLISSIDAAFESISECAKSLVNAERVSYCVLEPDKENIRIIGLVGSTTDSTGQVLSLERSGLAEILIEGKRRYISDLLNSKVESQRALGRGGLRHLWSLPIVGDNQILGALNIGSRRIGLDAKDATSVLATLSRFLGSTLQRLSAEQQTKRMMEEAERQARTDMLTGLPNRVEFYRKLQQRMQIATDNNERIGVLFLDLDLFKNVNDTLGHAVGDELLCKIAQRLNDHLDADDCVARIGGDEFLIMRPGVSSPQALDEIGVGLLNAIKQPLAVADRTLQVGGSVGAVCFPDDGSSRDDLIKNADIAMYHAKASGRNQCRVFNDQLAGAVTRRVRLEALLRNAVSDNQLSLVFQPQYDFNTSRPVGVEALLRWIHPQEGFIPPDEFIGIAEQCGMIEQITDWVLEHSLQYVKEFRQYNRDLKVAVNVSASEFSSHSDLFNRVESALQRSGLPSSTLELELTETALLAHPEDASKLIQKLSAAGIHLAIDDFGTGYASMSYLIQLPINTIKIDRSFVDGLEHDSRKQAVVKGILAIANSMELYSVGEGVETVEQFGWLNRYGCQSAQGYLLSRPVAPEKIPEVLRSLGDDSQAA